MSVPQASLQRPTISDRVLLARSAASDHSFFTRRIRTFAQPRFRTTAANSATGSRPSASTTWANSSASIRRANRSDLDTHDWGLASRSARALWVTPAPRRRVTRWWMRSR